MPDGTTRSVDLDKKINVLMTDLGLLILKCLFASPEVLLFTP